MLSIHSQIVSGERPIYLAYARHLKEESRDESGEFFACLRWYYMHNDAMSHKLRTEMLKAGCINFVEHRGNQDSAI